MTVTLEGIREHQAPFQAIADANDDNRAAGTSDYDASAAYVSKWMARGRLRGALQEFTLAASGRRRHRSWSG